MMAMAMIQGAVLTAGSGQAGGGREGREREKEIQKELGTCTLILKNQRVQLLFMTLHLLFLHLKNSTCRSRKGLASGVNGFGFSSAATKYRKVHTPTKPSQRTDSAPVAAQRVNKQ